MASNRIVNRNVALLRAHVYKAHTKTTMGGVKFREGNNLACASYEPQTGKITQVDESNLHWEIEGRELEEVHYVYGPRGKWFTLTSMYFPGLINPGDQARRTLKETQREFNKNTAGPTQTEVEATRMSEELAQRKGCLGWVVSGLSRILAVKD